MGDLQDIAEKHPDLPVTRNQRTRPRYEVLDVSTTVSPVNRA
jgi:hypothetical protein